MRAVAGLVIEQVVHRLAVNHHRDADAFGFGAIGCVHVDESRGAFEAPVACARIGALGDIEGDREFGLGCEVFDAFDRGMIAELLENRATAESIEIDLLRDGRSWQQQ